MPLKGPYFPARRYVPEANRLLITGGQYLAIRSKSAVSLRAHDAVCKFPWVAGRLLVPTDLTFCCNLRKEPGMARQEKSTKEVEKIDPYLEEVAKNLVDRPYGPNGPAWGTKLTELEDVVVAVRGS